MCSRANHRTSARGGYLACTMRAVFALSENQIIVINNKRSNAHGNTLENNKLLKDDIISKTNILHPFSNLSFSFLNIRINFFDINFIFIIETKNISKRGKAALFLNNYVCHF